MCESRSITISPFQLMISSMGGLATGPPSPPTLVAPREPGALLDIRASMYSNSAPSGSDFDPRRTSDGRCAEAGAGPYVDGRGRGAAVAGGAPDQPGRAHD